MPDVEAFILIEAKPGQALELVREVRGINGIKAVYAVTGPFDLVAHVGAPSVPELGRMVVAKIQSAAAVNRTLTCLVVEEGS